MSLIKQPDAYSCGPACVANALYLLGNAGTPIDKIKFHIRCDLCPTNATYNGFLTVLRTLSLNMPSTITRIEKQNIENSINSLKQLISVRR